MNLVSIKINEYISKGAKSRGDAISPTLCGKQDLPVWKRDADEFALECRTKVLNLGQDEINGLSLWRSYGVVPPAESLELICDSDEKSLIGVDLSNGLHEAPLLCGEVRLRGGKQEKDPAPRLDQGALSRHLPIGEICRGCADNRYAERQDTRRE